MLENSTPLDREYGRGPELLPQGAANLRKAGKWGRFLGVLSMAGIGFFLVVMVLFGGTFMAVSGLGAATGGGGFMTGVLVIYALVFLFLFYLSYLLYQFGSEAVAAVDNGSPQSVTDAFGALARLFKLYGILAIFYLGSTVLAFLSMLFTGASAFL
ncbi:hypothetical protein GGR26_002843 [Lewinella marina]|uniref:Uncharacterized protein n=1 Tax=Neolewinella marina TaxID=438751 RepID=A0A2G0CBT2_9BACT|nr:hypothetical protein [Neolewinella marina]NJB87066.1 hypothetical protein [Neolewinella marina]PHK97400.1 hypothetical protein CGL56_16485 [Neolewinella marina]